MALVVCWLHPLILPCGKRCCGNTRQTCESRLLTSNIHECTVFPFECRHILIFWSAHPLWCCVTVWVMLGLDAFTWKTNKHHWNHALTQVLSAGVLHSELKVGGAAVAVVQSVHLQTIIHRFEWFSLSLTGRILTAYFLLPGKNLSLIAFIYLSVISTFNSWW